MLASWAGKVVLVTGGNTGIECGIIKAVATLQPAHSSPCARNKAKADAAIAFLDVISKTRIEYLPLDLAEVTGIQACAKACNHRCGRLDILFLNAGNSFRAPGVIKYGYEIHFGVKYLGHMLLLQLLLPKTVAEYVSNARVAAVSSISGMLFRPTGGLALENMQSAAEDLSAIVGYGHSKHAWSLAMRKRHWDIGFSSVCSGNDNTDLWNQMDGLGWFTNTALAPLILRLTGISVDEAARLPLWCAASARGEGQDEVKDGGFYHPTSCQLKSSLRNVTDDELCEELMVWTKTELGLPSEA